MKITSPDPDGESDRYIDLDTSNHAAAFVILRQQGGGVGFAAVGCMDLLCFHPYYASIVPTAATFFKTVMHYDVKLRNLEM
jgi:hypothetical protein